MALSTAHKEAYARAESNVRHLLCVELRHSQFPGGVIRQVNYNTDVTIFLEATAPLNPSTWQLFAGEGMDVREPEIGTDAGSTLDIALDATSGVVTPLLYNAVQVPEPILATVRPVGYNVTTTAIVGIVGAIHLEVKGIAITNDTIALNLGFVNSSNKDFPSINYTPTSHPGLYS